MAKWMRFILDSGLVGTKRLLTPATFREIEKPQIRVPLGLYPALRLARPHGFSYALGWFVQDYEGEVVWMHTGSINGMSAILGLLPDHRVGVMVLANLDHVELRHALMYKVFDMYSGNAPRDWSSELRALFTRSNAPAPGARPAAGEAKISLPLERYGGTYVDSAYGEVVVTHGNGALQARFGNQEIGTLEPWGYEAFRSPQQGTVLAFTRDASGNVLSVRVFGVNFMRSSR
jgi:hypothetical protein